MSTCMRCNGPEFTLNKETGVQTCSACGQENYIGSPDSYAPLPEMEFNKKTGSFDRKPFFDNAGFDNPDD